MSNVNTSNQAKSSITERDIKALLTDNLSDLRRYAYSLTNNTHDADDLLQSVIERILNKSIPSDVQPLAWIYRVCRNLWIDELRKRKIRQVPIGYEDHDIEDSSIDSRPSKQIYQFELKKAIDELAEPYRAVVNLVIIAGLSYAEAAESLNIPEGTVMSRVARARQQLHTRLGSNELH